MINVRYNVFETNSSSTHCIAVLNSEQMAKLRSKSGYICIDENVISDFMLPSHIKLFEYADNIPLINYEVYDLVECNFRVIAESDSDKLFIVDLTLRN